MPFLKLLTLGEVAPVSSEILQHPNSGAHEHNRNLREPRLQSHESLRLTLNHASVFGSKPIWRRRWPRGEPEVSVIPAQAESQGDERRG